MVFIGLAVPVAGCIETGGGPTQRGGSQSCLDAQFFTLQWGIDHGAGTIPLTCSEVGTMASHVELTTNAASPDDLLLAAFNLECHDGWVCSDGSPCNLIADTFSGIPTGTTATSASLIGNDGVVLSTAEIPVASYPEYSLSRCQSLVLGFNFTLPTSVAQ
jgi:hypothetical protein